MEKKNTAPFNWTKVELKRMNNTRVTEHDGRF